MPAMSISQTATVVLDIRCLVFVSVLLCKTGWQLPFAIAVTLASHISVLAMSPQHLKLWQKQYGMQCHVVICMRRQGKAFFCMLCAHMFTP